MSKDADVQKPRNLSVKISAEENKMLAKVRRHYGFVHDADLIRALIKRASMNL